MFGIGFFELLLIAVFGLLIFGPEKLPEAIRSFTKTASKARRAWQSTRRELEQELGMDEIRREIHNAEIMESLEKIKKDQANSGNAAEDQGAENSILNEAASADDSEQDDSSRPVEPKTRD